MWAKHNSSNWQTLIYVVLSRTVNESSRTMLNLFEILSSFKSKLVYAYLTYEVELELDFNPTEHKSSSSSLINVLINTCLLIHFYLSNSSRNIYI